MKKMTILIAVCVALSASAWAQRGPGRGGMGMGMGPGTMGRGPVAGPMLDQQAPPVDEQPKFDIKQDAPNRPNGNPQGLRNIPPAVRQWLQNGGWAILRERFAQQRQMRMGPRAEMGQGMNQPQRPGMGMGRGMGMRGQGMGRGMGPGMQGPKQDMPQVQSVPCPRCQGQCDCPCCKAGIGGQRPRDGRGQFGQMGPMAGMGGRGMMQRFGQGAPDQPKDILKFRPEIKKFEGFKDKGDKANNPVAKFQKERKDNKDKAARDKMVRKEKDTDDEDENEQEDGDENEEQDDNDR